MIGSFLFAVLFWVVLLGLLYAGCYYPTWEHARKKRGKKATGWPMRVVYIIAWPITALFVLIGAVVIYKDVEDFFKK